MDGEDIDDFPDEIEMLDGEMDNEDLEHLENEAVERDDEQSGAKEEDDEEKKVVKPKKKVLNPRFTLNTELLKGPKGLGALEKCFERVKFKGKGHEEEDLNVLLKTYEYWCHRLYPKFPFLECVEKIERLGSKGPIQTYMKKVRSGMIDEDSAGDLPEFRSDEEDNTVEPTADNQRIMEDIPIELTEEQLETIRKNREKAELLRQERLKRIQEKAAMNMPGSSGLTSLDTLSQPNRLSDNVEDNQRNLESDKEDGNNEANGIDDEVFLSSKRRNRKFLDDSDEDMNTRTIQIVPISNEEINQAGIGSSEAETAEDVDTEGVNRNRKKSLEREIDEIEDVHMEIMGNPPEAMDRGSHALVLGEIQESPNKLLEQQKMGKESLINSEDSDLRTQTISANGLGKENQEQN